MLPDEWGFEDEARDRKELVAAVDYFGEALGSKEDIADDLVDPRYPLTGPMAPLADWCKVVDAASWNNRDWALGLWHVLVGQVLRDQRIRVGRAYFDGRFHLLILSPSGTGKTRAADQVRELISKLYRYELGTQGALVPKQFEIRPVLEATTAALVGSAEVQKVKGGAQIVPIPGLLETADLLHWDEAEALFAETGYNANMLRTLNMTMNPIGSPGNMVVKELRGVSNVVQPKCSLLLTAVDFLTIPEQILRNGFFQRIGVMRKQVTPDQRRANRRREKQLVDTEPDMDPELQRARDYLMDLAKFYRTAQHWKFGHVSGMMLNKYEKMLEAAGQNEQVRPYLEDFAERYMDKLYVLSMHNAAMRNFVQNGTPLGTYWVEVEDVARAWVVVKTCMRQFFFYLAEIAISWKYAHEKAVRRRYLEGKGFKP